MSENKPKLLLLFTNHRVAEKIYGVIPSLSEYFDIDLFAIGLFSLNTPWVGDNDERLLFIETYKQYLQNIFIGPGVKYHGDRITEDLSKFIDTKKYSVILYDDNRPMPEFNLPNLYKEFKKYKNVVIGNPHGNEEYRDYPGLGVTFDKMFSLGYKEKYILDKNFNIKDKDLLSGGIPTNDRLKNYSKRNKHILVITNYLGNRTSSFPVKFDSDFVAKSGLNELSKELNLPIVVKQKARLDDPDYKKNEDYIKSILNCKVVTSNDTDTEQLIADSAVVISALSTLAFKPIQLNIPTVLIKGTGQVGNFYDYDGLLDLDYEQIYSYIKSYKPSDRFVMTTIKGGEIFNSSYYYTNEVIKAYENNL